MPQNSSFMQNKRIKNISQAEKQRPDSSISKTVSSPHGKSGRQWSTQCDMTTRQKSPRRSCGTIVHNARASVMPRAAEMTPAVQPASASMDAIKSLSIVAWRLWVSSRPAASFTALPIITPSVSLATPSSAAIEMVSPI